MIEYQTDVPLPDDHTGRMKPDDLAEREAVLELYRSALGMP